MTQRDLPSPELLRKVMRYDPVCGKLFWLERPEDMFPDTGYGGRKACAAKWNARFAGKEAMIAVKSWGLYGRVLGKKVYSHRAIWAMQTGQWPEKIIDHINGNPFDNRWSNLREVTYAQNSWNRGLSGRNKSGYKGVSQNKKDGKWYAQISVTYGPFDLPDEAAKAYDFASDYLHGEYKRKFD